MSDDTYFFEVSVAEHPQTKKRMNDLAKSVLDAQSQMTKAVSMVGDAATASTKNIGSMVDMLDGLKSGGVASLRSIQDEIKALQELSKQKIVQTVQIQHNNVGGASSGTAGGDAAAPQKPVQEWVASTSPISDYSDALQDSHVKDKQVWEAKVQTQKQAFEKAAADYDAAIQVQNRSSDEMNKAALKGARGLIDAAKGWAQLGLVGEENSKKLVEGLVLVEGAFNIAKGGVEFLEAFGQGWKAVRSSQEAANNVSKITASLRSAEFAQLRAYHLALVQEAEVASVAAAANGRLAASRTAAAGAAGSGAVTGAATSVAGSAIGGAVAGGGGAVAAGAAWNTLGGVALGGAATVATFAAAVAGAGFGLRALYDVVTGTGNEVGSFNDTIATWEVGVASAAAGMVGFTTSVAASQKKLTEAEQRSVKLRADVDKRYADENVRRDAANATARASFENRNQIRSIDAGDDKSAQLAAATERRLDAAKLLAEQTAKMGDLEARNQKHTEEYRDAQVEATKYRKDLLDAIQDQGKLQADVTKAEIEGQKKVQEETRKKIEESKKGLEDLEKSQQSAVENFAKLDKVQQVTAIKALDKARATGGASLSDKEKDLLRSVGTDEAKRLASEGDKAEANAAGFDRTFGAGFEAERQAMDATQKTLEAELSTRFDFTIKTESNQQQMLDALKEAAKSTISEENRKAIEAVQRLMNEGLAKNSQEWQQGMRARNRNG